MNRYKFVIGLSVGPNTRNFVVRQTERGCKAATKDIGEARMFDTYKQADTARSGLNDLWVRRARIYRVTVTVTEDDEYSN